MDGVSRDAIRRLAAELADDADPAAVAIRRALGERGWLYSFWPRAWGGAGLTPGDACRLERALLDAGVGLPDMEADDRAAALIAHLGSPGQVRRWLPELAAGRERCVLHPSLTGGPAVAAARSGDGWVLIEAPAAGSALPGHDHQLVLLRCEPSEELAVAIVPALESALGAVFGTQRGEKGVDRIEILGRPEVPERMWSVIDDGIAAGERYPRARARRLGYWLD
ncbi:MAG: hypothetical protein D6773_04610, partial [Alphaproteobacteria bacterium]